MKKYFFYPFACLILLLGSCESELNGELEISEFEEELVETKLLLDGEEISFYTDVGGDEPMVIQNKDYLKLMKLVDEGELGFYYGVGFDDPILFSSH